MEPTPIDTILIKYLSGEASQAEIAEVESWREASEANRQTFAEYQKVWQGLDRVNDLPWVDTEADWKQLEARLEQPMLVPEPAKGQKSGGFALWKIAAAVALLVLSGILLFRNLNQQEVLQTGLAEIQEVALQDGSQITLNAASVLKYPDAFEGNFRRVSLEGEAYFEVAHKPEQPFVVQVADYRIKVLGTAFNIDADEKGGLTVSVKEGKVAVYRQGNEAEAEILTAGQGVALRETKLVRLKSIDPHVISWKTRRLKFRRAQLAKVVNDINRTYHSKVKLQDAELNSCTITVSFDGQSLEDVLSVITATLGLEQIRQADGTILLTGDGC